MAKEPKYRIEHHESNPHGGPFELEIHHYYYVIDNGTNTVVMTFEGDYNASYGDSGWENESYSGVEDAKISDDGSSVLVYDRDKEEPRIIALP